MNAAVGTKNVFSHLPLIRFTTIATVLVATESLISIALWLAGGDSLYLEDSVEKFLFTHSTFDLACLAAVRGLVVAVCLFYLESNLVQSQSAQRKYDSSRQTALLCFVMMLLVAATTLVYALVKGVMVLVEVLNRQWNDNIDPELRMSVPYMVLSVLAIVFSCCRYGARFS